jgi:putative radical SAM enzyme (TIGR03279 family)
MMDIRVKSTIKGSIAAEIGISAGDRILSVNGRSDLEDLFDYEFEVMSETEISLEVLHANGTTQIYELEIEPGDDLGIQFESPIFTPIKTCNNACPFCFIDQQPEGLRASLYVKDDDYRLSYFCNTYITLTNLTQHDRERISRIRPGPLYVSVHSTVPEIRQILLKNKKAGDIMKELRWLADLEIPFHAQLVICPEINDRESLEQSLQDLSTLRPHCLSVAIVPLGLTTYRNQLPELTPVSKAHAEGVLDRLQTFVKETGLKDFAFASDEFYVLSERPMPRYNEYGDFPQLDDGVGTAKLLTHEFFDLEKTLPESVIPPRNHLILTGELGGMILQPVVQRLNRIEGLFLDLLPIQNRFWGDAVTVAGLITGQDIMDSLKSHDLSGYQSVLIPETMLKSGENLFLDGYTVAELEAHLGCKIQVVTNPSRAQSLLDTLFTAEKQH